ncbi:MAG: class IV adenylate cyclase [Planctomycetota bacterium]|jgi:adenylate cyclase class 2
MCIEIEAKLKVDSLQEIAETLTALGAEFVQEQMQTDYYFDDESAILTKTDRCLRLRRQLTDRDERAFLTYKGAKEKDEFKKRREIEFEVTDADSVEKVLSAIGYERASVVEKKRRVWRFRQCSVALDELQSLGNFVEIEGSDSQTITDVQRELGLADLPHIPRSYASLIAKKLGQ